MMGDNGFSDFKKPDASPFRLFAESAFLPAFCNPNASPPNGVVGTQAQRVTEPAVNGASELHIHEWLRPDNGVIECATCGKEKIDYEHLP